MLRSLFLSTAVALGLAATANAAPTTAKSSATQTPGGAKLSVQIDAPTQAILARVGERVALSKAERADLAALVQSLSGEAGPADVQAEVANTAWSKVVESQARRHRNMDIDALIQLVLVGAYLDASEDLSSYAAKVKHFNAAKKEIRDHIRRTRRKLGDAPDEKGFSVRTMTITSSFNIGMPPTVLAPAKMLSAGQIRDALAKLEARLPAVDEEARAATADLHGALKVQPELLEKIKKTNAKLRASAMAIIGNLR